jgi:hypothetical protein
MRAKEDISVTRTPKRRIQKNMYIEFAEGSKRTEKSDSRANATALAETPGALHIGTGCGRAWLVRDAMRRRSQSTSTMHYDAEIAGLKTRTYNFFARRNELSAKRKNSRAKATAAAMSQWAMSRLQERMAMLSQTIPRNANRAPTTSKKSCFAARQKRWKPPWRCAAAGEVAAEDIGAS